MSVVTLVIGIILFLYGKVVPMYSSTVTAMAGIAAKFIARWLGLLMCLSGAAGVLTGM